MFYEILQVTILFFNAEHSGFKFACDSFTTSSKTLMYAGHLLAKTFRRRCRRRRRRRQLHCLRSTHTRPLSRRNTMGRIIMYSVSLRDALPSFRSSLLFSLLSPRSRSRARKKRNRKKRMRRTWGRREPRRFPRRKTVKRGASLGSPLLAHGTRIHSLPGPTPPPRVRWVLRAPRLTKKGGGGGERAVCRLVDATFTSERASERASLANGAQKGARAG